MKRSLLIIGLILSFSVFAAPALRFVDRIQYRFILEKRVRMAHPGLPQIRYFLGPKPSPEASLVVAQLDHAPS